MFGILVYSFNIINLNFILSNIILIPIFEIITIIGIVNILGIGLLICMGLKPEVVLSYWIIERILRYMYMIIDFMLDIVIKITNILSSFKYNIYVRNFNIAIYILYYLIIIFLCIYIILKAKNIKIDQNITTENIIKDIINIIIFLCIIFGITILINIIYDNSVRKNIAYFVDIGQGDSSLIQTKDGKNILIDTGEGESNRYPAGKKILFPYLLKRNVHKLDLLIISHFDSDHSGGAKYILENMEVDKIIISPQFRYSKQYIEVMKVIIENNKKGKKTDVIYGINGGIIKCGKYFNMKIYGPINKYITKNILNNNSLVFLVTIGNKKILYTGDIEKIAEEQIIKRIEGIHIDYLKVAHHGSRSSTTDIFLKNIKCKYFVISCRSK